jgi:hypothetical protein
LPLIEWITVRLDVSENEWRRHNKDMEPQRTGSVPPLHTRKRNRTLGLRKTTRRSCVHVQTIGLNAEPKKDRHLADGEICLLTFPFIGLVRLAQFWARANYNRAKMRCMVRSLGLAFLCAVIAFVSCSQPANVQRVADIGASQLKNRIPPPNPSKYRSVRDARDWQNPYLMVQENGIRLITEMKRLQISHTHF